jgi:hypothetical protein
MHFSSAILVLATATSVAAQPTLHHRHNQVHERRRLQAREPLTFFMDQKPRDAGSSSNDSNPNDKTGDSQAAGGSGGSGATGSGAAGSNSAGATTSAAGNTGSTGTGQKKPFCNGEPTNVKRATAFDIAYKGNTGSKDKWGCNIMEVPCADLALYDYGTEFHGGNGGDVYSCSAFNKIGPTGGIDPGWHSALDFQVARGETKCIAFDKNSQGSVACDSGTGGPRKTSFGQMAGAWYEFDCGSDKNDNQSGSDVSVLVANANNIPYIGMAVEAPGKGMCSWLKSTGENFQAYMGGMEDLDGVGCTGYSKGVTKVTLGY